MAPQMPPLPSHYSHNLPGVEYQIPRTDVLNELQDDIEEIASEDSATVPIPGKIINYYGITGVGKSFLIDQIFERFQHEYHIVWMDFDTIRPSSFAQKVWSLNDVVDWLHTKLGLELPSTSALADRDVRADMYHLRFAAKLDHQASTPLLLLLDHLDDLLYWKWLQEYVLKPLFDTPALVVCTSQSPLFWHFWELGESCDPRPLQPFDVDQTREFLALYDRALMTHPAQELTHGYPMQLREMVAALEITANTESQPPGSVEELLHQLAPTTQQILTSIGLLRWLEVDVIRSLLDAISPEWKGDARESPHQILLGYVLPDLKAHGALTPYYRGQLASRLVPWLRRALEERIRAADQERYLQICALLTQIYYERFIAKPIVDAQVLNEWIYFSSAPLLLAHDESARATWTEQLRHLLSRARLASERIALLSFRDKEIQARLRQTGLLILTEQLLREYLEIDDHAPALLNRAELARYRQHVLDRLTGQPPATEIQTFIPGGIPTLLAAMLAIGPYFDLMALYQRLNAQSDRQVTQGAVNHAVALLRSCGLIAYDREERKYQLTNALHAIIGEPAITASQDS